MISIWFLWDSWSVKLKYRHVLKHLFKVSTISKVMFVTVMILVSNSGRNYKHHCLFNVNSKFEYYWNSCPKPNWNMMCFCSKRHASTKRVLSNFTTVVFESIPILFSYPRFYLVWSNGYRGTFRGKLYTFHIW